MKDPVFSVIIPAHNEERYVARCIHSVRTAAQYAGLTAEIIVVCNRCTDRTQEIAEKCGARVLANAERCIASVRNTGIRAARGKVIVTIDCDNRMTRGTLREIAELLATGNYIGGGAPIRFERYSLPLWCNDMMCRALFRCTGLYCGIFWAKRSVFLAVGGFVEQKAMEDAATARVLKQYGRAHGRKYTVLRRNYLINSTRKYDEMGDWLYFRLLIENAGAFLRAAAGDRSGVDALLDRLFYDYNG
ncbi:MAG: glycosyltransferase [Oscillospiraceae bacterium]|nr:glycosyltransferase [Oscillospiraceae bacterium]MBQ9696612.1 glycosyltransferase [Oscillospiraceae bacterium]MBR1897598.1 glycosyltransferase [Oscillospiraceae bacterium]